MLPAHQSAIIALVKGEWHLEKETPQGRGIRPGGEERVEGHFLQSGKVCAHQRQVLGHRLSDCPLARAPFCS